MRDMVLKQESLQDAMELRLDDGRRAQDPGTPWFLSTGQDDAHPLRVGSTLHGVAGVLDQRFGSYRLQLTEEIARVALFLASDEASFVNGATVVADAGWTSY